MWEVPESELRDLFCRRLQGLVAQRPSIKQVCDELGINRTQFARYMSGQAVPRGTVIYRIAQYFDVSVEYFFVEGAHDDVALRGLGEQMQGIFAGRDFMLNQVELRPGFYRYWRYSFLAPERVIGRIVHVTDQGGLRRVRSKRCRYLRNLVRGGLLEKRDRDCVGLAMKSGEGVAIFHADTQENITVYTYIFPDITKTLLLGPVRAVWRGFSVSAGVASGRSRTIVPIIYEQLRDDWPSVMWGARGAQIFGEGEAPDAVTEALEAVEIPRFAANI